MPHPRPSGRERLPGRDRLWGLDGLRALAVAAVVAFHLDPDAVRGGFLGVDVFFAISGFLITRLLLLEMHDTGRLDLLGFYGRRWRRLVPSVLVLLAVVTVAGLAVWRDEVPTLRGGVLSSLGYVTNWWLIGDHQSYFVATGRPPMTQHLWSLAIEEQFYLVWPLLLAGLVGWRCLRRGGDARAGLDPLTVWRVSVAAGVLGLASGLAMAGISIARDIPYGADSARVYFGTDTHAAALLFGAGFGALAAAATTRSARRWTGRRRRRAGLLATDVIAVAGLGVLVWQVVVRSEFDPALYRTGFTLIGLCAAVTVATLARPGSGVGRLLELRILRWVGRRSYAIYLWHWPVVVVTRPDLDVSGPRWLLVVNQIGLILALAAVSYAVVERPVRSGALRRWWNGYPRPAPRPRRSHPRLAAVLSVAVVTAAVVAVQQSGGTSATAQRAFTPPPSTASVATTGPARTAQPGPTAHPTRSTRRSAQPSPTRSQSPRPSPPPTVSAFGDSVMLGAAPALATALPGIGVSAVEGRQARAVFGDIDAAHRARRLGAVVVIHTGDNGIVSTDDLRATLASLHGRRRVVLLTVRVPRDWQGPNNAVLTSVGRQFANVRVVDWYARSSGHGPWFYADGLHLRPAGQQAYAALVRAAIDSR